MHHTHLIVLPALAGLLAMVTMAGCGRGGSVETVPATAAVVEQIPFSSTAEPTPAPSSAVALPATAAPAPTERPLSPPLSPSPTRPLPASPSVVPTRTPTARPSLAPDGCTAETALSRIRPSVVRVVNERSDGRFSVGSGYAVAPSGQLVTNEHVVNGAARLSVVLADGRQVPARVLRADEGRDLALLVAPGAALPPVRFSQRPVPTGQQVYAVGFPQSAAPTLEPTLMSGTVITAVVVNGATFLQTDVPASVGASGGPLLTPCGEVVGTVSSGAPQTMGITFGVAAADVQAFLAGGPPLRPAGPTPAAPPALAPTLTPAVTARPGSPTPASARTPPRQATASP
jgi:S1-C subfamily serine protease